MKIGNVRMIVTVPETKFEDICSNSVFTEAELYGETVFISSVKPIGGGLLEVEVLDNFNCCYEYSGLYSFSNKPRFIK